ncbi:MAG: hypothetical protein K9N09_04865 [Candidatus Cloacimonetes bacterium]|nr:hypothetical protein [Candidatus Cloacimonadota bacterium]MCF7815149.1 hypothetical protein [Candidatus Cloacimonadota bacterium]MCF7868014.1 hypothetical protein [Candidatus Cloacimonadota bacterium]MCF7883472.1 hypothetical protein [Candidatus Cloacimonadota bacterium]
MFKDEIYKKGMLQAPEDQEIDLLLYAAEKVQPEAENEAWEDYLKWLPFAELMLLIKDWMEGYKISVRPIMKI